MDWSKVKSSLVTIAPWIAGTFGTPAAGVAVKALCGILGVDSNSATPESVQAAISGATPDQLLALKQADLKHQEFMAQLGYDNLAKLAQYTTDDVVSARSLASQDIAGGNNITRFMSATVRPVAGYIAIVAVAWAVYTGKDMTPMVKDVVETIVEFYFGGRVLEKIMPHVSQAASNIGTK